MNRRRDDKLDLRLENKNFKCFSLVQGHRASFILEWQCHTTREKLSALCDMLYPLLYLAQRSRPVRTRLVRLIYTDAVHNGIKAT